jgi:hypothetical protein
LTPEELEKLTGANRCSLADPGAIAVERRIHARPQTPKQREFEARVKEAGAQLAKKHSMTRRAFFKTAGGMAPPSPR